MRRAPPPVTTRAARAAPWRLPGRPRHGPPHADSARRAPARYTGSPMKIGHVEVPSLARMAPMAGITNAPLPLIVNESGSGLNTTQEIDAPALRLEHPHRPDIPAEF